MFVVFLLVTGCSPDAPQTEFWIKNSQGESIYLQVDGAEDSGHKKLAIIQHGLASNKKLRP